MVVAVTTFSLAAALIVLVPGPDTLVVLRALKRYGAIVADNGPSWHISGAPDPRWSNEDLEQIKRVPGSAFEVVQSGPIRHTR